MILREKNRPFIYCFIIFVDLKRKIQDMAYLHFVYKYKIL